MKQIITLCLLHFCTIMLNAQAPVITSFTPLTAKPGDAVTLAGTGFNTTAANNIVFCGATRATVTAATATSVTITIPSGATYDYITLINTGTSLVANSRLKFTPTYSPQKTGFTTTDFEAPVNFASNTNSTNNSVEIADIDGDGKPDILLTSGALSVSVYRNTSTPGSISASSFAAKVDFITGVTVNKIAVADLDGDGKPELITANRTARTISVFRNTSTPGTINSSSFATKVDFSTAGIPNSASFRQPYAIAIADFDGDGKLDIAVAARSITIILRNTSSIGSFSFVSSDIVVSQSSTSIVAADFNNDGKPDLIVIGESGAGTPGSANVLTSSTVFTNTSSVGNISFSGIASNTINISGAQFMEISPDIALRYPASRLSVCDIDGDGKLDLVAAPYMYKLNNGANVTLVRNISNSTIVFEAAVPLYNLFGVTGTAVGDIDGNGKPDLAAFNGTATIIGSGSTTLLNNISVLLNTASTGSVNTNSFAASVDFSRTAGFSYTAAIGDLDGDGRPDLVSATFGVNNISIYRNADPTCTPTTDTFIVAACGSYTWAAKGNKVYTANNNTDTIVLTNAGGCDSVVTLNLTVKTNYTITANAGSNGSISNSGASTICEGNNQSYTITPNANYHIVDVLVDGVSQGAISTYSFTDVTANHTIAVSFAANCIASTSSTTQTACGNYVWGGTTYTASGDYVKHFTNSCGLDSSATLHLTINAATSSTQTASVCSNQLPFIWNGLTFNIAGTQTKTGLMNSKGCDSSATLTLSVATASTPTISVSVTSNPVCSGILVTFTAIATNQGTAPVYQWKKNGVNVGTNSNTYSSPSLVDKDSIWCVLTSNSACATTATATSNKIKMTVNLSPLVSPVKSNIGVNITSQTMCTIGGFVTLYNTYLGGTWSSSNPSVATAVNGALVTGVGVSSSGLLTAVGNGITTVTYTIANSNGCAVSASATIFVDAVPTLNAITGVSSGVCIGGNITLSNTSIVPAGGSGVWLSTAGRATVNAATGVVTGVNAGTGSIKYTITNANGCSNSAVTSIVVNSLPGVPSINYAAGTVNPQIGASFCNNRTFTLVGNPTGGVWSSTNASVVTVTSAGLTKTVGLGSGSIVYTYTNANGCSSSRSIVGNVVTCVPRGVNGGVASSEKLVASGEFTMYPNPAKSVISLNVNTLIGSGAIVFTDLYGKQVKTQPLSMGTNTISIASFAKGIYFVSIITEQGKQTQKVIVE